MPNLAPSLALGLTALPSSFTSSPTSAATAVLSPSPPPLLPPTPATMAGWFGWVLTFVFQVIPRCLYWLIAFTTITLPTWLFTLFSMSLTFTMNFTTLYASAASGPMT
ncbi:lysophospholipase NTE1 [Penicillium chermesinum]|uniref:Lysophospholipase NTE1 n=1 Tax=Penicillium chermesinum TaxID=63820 RepID=A0A9W9NGZ5_9EURO|nr:lysophospholipase NTE1 [Penicillium chermesinum]KAJ5219568.1 lysophospholipase NTE1 [Penicillium chermesinum]